MENHFIKVATAIPRVHLGNIEKNVEEINRIMLKAADKADIIVFPELSVTGYSCGDLFHSRDILDVIEYLTVPVGLVAIIGTVREYNGKLINGALVVTYEGFKGFVGKKNLPGYNEFYEERWFSEDETDPVVFEYGDVKFGIELCEDLWAPVPPSTELVKRGAEIIFNLSASNELIGKHEYLRSLIKQQSARLICGYVYSGAGFGESSQDLVYSGKGIIAENGRILNEVERFDIHTDLLIDEIDLDIIRHDRLRNTTFAKFIKAENQIYKNLGPILPRPRPSTRNYNKHPFVPSDIKSRTKEILSIQSLGLARRLSATKMKPVIGISGGSDSTWALIVCVEACKILGIPTSEIIGVTMPGFATGSRTKGNSIKLMEALGVDSKEIDITEICKAELKALGHDGITQDITYENVQARTRTQILMNLSNKEHGLVIGTGDLSELALGWCTYNADHMSMYGVNCSVPKTLIKALIENYECDEKVKEILTDILDTPVSPELKDNQITEDNVGPYELHDFFLFHYLRYGFSKEKIKKIAIDAFKGNYTKEEITKWLDFFMMRFKTQQFKRSCLPDGPKIGSVSLSPRGDWRMPSDME